MIQKNPFLKYMMKDKKEDVFHSSAYAKVQNGAGIGAASTESYRVRVNIDRNRQVVRGYKDSKIINDSKNQIQKAKTYDAASDLMNKDLSGGIDKNDSSSVATKRAMMAAKK
ncbi:hypothetical protein IJ076_00450 [Candidatus Saccharibacteria bacterium]|nr:hypothetical protein [Candidatus Saccharibacteria bacterium]